MGYARPPILSADVSCTGKGFAAFFEVHGEKFQQIELGDRAGLSGGVVSGPGGNLLTQSGIGIHMIRSLHTCCGLRTPG